jgi:hypothetical protein
MSIAKHLNLRNVQSHNNIETKVAQKLNSSIKRK